MKNNSMNIAPKGRTPPTAICQKFAMYQTCFGTCLGILFVRTGSSETGAFVPRYDPRNTRGALTPNQRNISKKNVPKGTAPELLWPQIIVLSAANTTKMTLGNANAAQSVFHRQSMPFTCLYSLPETYPLTKPMATYKITDAVIKPPRFAGDRNPARAKIRVMVNIHPTCAPVPTKTHKTPAFVGGRNTSPCTSFHPASSACSSGVSRELYLVMSLRSVRSMISPTIPDRNKTIIMLFTMENQWICVSVIKRYVSHRLAHLMSLGVNSTSYVKMISSPALTSCGGSSYVTYFMRPGLHVSKTGFDDEYGFS
mmetsp:Transcript_12426/g.41333  ORF Transcript_12426/g.41333 Transcript_12426/m.41333 type:complete len:311 (-) Transcript_12426:706-1638(-)